VKHAAFIPKEDYGIGESDTPPPAGDLQQSDASHDAENPAAKMQQGRQKDQHGSRSTPRLKAGQSM
jgi:hypothetical protein